MPLKLFLILFSAFSFSFAGIGYSANSLHDDENLRYWVTILRDSPFPLYRKNAAKNLGKIADARTLQYVVTGLEDPSVEVRLEVASALSRWGDPSTIPSLERVAASDTSREVQKACRQAIAKIHARVEFEKKQIEKLETKLKQHQ